MQIPAQPPSLHLANSEEAYKLLEGRRLAGFQAVIGLSQLEEVFIASAFCRWLVMKNKRSFEFGLVGYDAEIVAIA